MSYFCSCFLKVQLIVFHNLIGKIFDLGESIGIFIKLFGASLGKFLPIGTHLGEFGIPGFVKVLFVSQVFPELF